MNKHAENLALSKILMSPKNQNGLYTINNESVSYEALNETLKTNLQELAGTPKLYRANKNDLFALIEETLDDVVPKNIIDTYGMFAEVKTIGQGDKAIFSKKLGKMRAKQFVTRAALASRYESFELADTKFEIQTTAYGGAARIGFEEFLDGRVQWSDYLDIVNEGMSEAVYKEIANNLISAIAKFPATNRASGANFDEAVFDRLIQTVSVYGSPVIYCTKEAAMTLIPSNNWISDNMRDSHWANGYFQQYKGTPVVILPQSFVDETNKMKVIDPAYLYIFPTANDKPIKIAFEGNTVVKDFENRDLSMEMMTYQKFGVGVMHTNNLAVYRNTSLVKDNPAGIW